MKSEIKYKLGMITLFCRRVAETKSFYINNLGLAEIREMSSPTFATLMTNGGSLIGLQDVKKSIGGQTSTHGEVELGLEVEDVDATYKVERKPLRSDLASCRSPLWAHLSGKGP